MSQKIDKRLVQTEKAVLEAGIRVLLSNPGGGMSDIAKAAGIGRATLYRHFPTRELLVRKLAMMCHTEMEEALRPYEELRGVAAFEAMIETFVPMADRFRFLLSLWTIAMEDEGIVELNTEMRQEMFNLIDHAKEIGDLSPELSTSWIAEFFDATIVAAWTLIEKGEMSAHEATFSAKASFLNGCGAG